MAKTLIVVAGPTAIGKTSLAIQLALYYQTEIISADSRQFYREMEIGTAKPSEEEFNTVPHHFINSLSINDNYSVGDYEREALILIERLFILHDIVVLVGGSGLFINAIVNGFDEIPTASVETREKLNELFKQRGISALQERLKTIDPEYYKEADINNPQRLIRAIEVYETSGKPFSEYRRKAIKKRPFNIIQIGLNTDRETLYTNINARVDLMIANGLVQEVEGLQLHRHLNPLNTVGYSELFKYFDGDSSLEEAVQMIKQNTRRFAKRQLTWFKKSGDVTWFKPDEFENIINYLNSRLHDHEHGERKN
ncbi:MAG: tRNA (adenosine(37)-N6)-dimethylallyltransferase MiaA [Daejeonella sp.]|uniref:tRNA (adenosine(37)-N6)-dimethylallyltransferase MiaA n=1 Tax=Daejeonella sp. TaxID=2805397 RepID=UPI003C723DB5